MPTARCAATFAGISFWKPRAPSFSRGTVRGELYDLGEYPGAIPSQNSSTLVRGEVYRLPHPERTLQVLDHVEGIASGSPEQNQYRRALACVTLENGMTVEAWIYWLNRHTGPRRRIPSGKYEVNSG